MRLTVDICAIAPRCNLEDHARRNGSNWAAIYSSLPQPVRARDSGDEGSVDVDANETKLRILSKMNDSSLSLPKVKIQIPLTKPEKTRTSEVTGTFPLVQWQNKTEERQSCYRVSLICFKKTLHS